MVLIENRKHAMFFVFILGHFLDTNSFHACHILIFPLIVQFFISMVFQKVGILKVNKLSTYMSTIYWICKNDKECYCSFRRINLWCNYIQEKLHTWIYILWFIIKYRIDVSLIKCFMTFSYGECLWSYHLIHCINHA